MPTTPRVDVQTFLDDHPFSAIRRTLLLFKDAGLSPQTAPLISALFPLGGAIAALALVVKQVVGPGRSAGKAVDAAVLSVH
jgi:hypothetical protein